MTKLNKIEKKLNPPFGSFHQNSSDSVFIVCHGYLGSKDDYAVKELAIQLHKKGHSAFRFTFSDQKNFNLIQEVNELVSVIDFFKPEYKNIILIGGSMGALVASIASIKKSGVSHLVLVNGFFYLFFGITWDFLKVLIITFLFYPFSRKIRGMINFYLFTFNPAKINIPTLVIYGENDQILNPKFQSIKFFEQLKTAKKIVHIKDIDHSLSKKEHVIKTAYSILDFINNG